MKTRQRNVFDIQQARFLHSFQVQMPNGRWCFVASGGRTLAWETEQARDEARARVRKCPDHRLIAAAIAGASITGDRKR